MNYTDEQIKERVKKCAESLCSKCLTQNDNCAVSDMDVFDLINRQEAEIAELKSELTITTNNYNHVTELFEAERKKVDKLHEKLMTAYKLLKSAKSEGVKEFAQRLKKKRLFIAGGSVVFVSDIDNLVKEMVGESE